MDKHLAAFCTAQELSEEIVDNLLKLHNLLQVYSQKINLISPNDHQKIQTRHILDSLQILNLLPKEGIFRHTDFGSGAGFPVLPLACVKTDWEIHAVEPRKKRCTFLDICRRELGLKNFRVHEARLEDYQPSETSDFVSARAVSETVKDWQRAKTILSDNGKFITFKFADEPFCEESGRFEYSLPGENRKFALLYFDTLNGA